MMFSPDMDPQWESWYHSPIQRIKRRLAALIGGEVVFIIFNQPFSIGVKLGLTHWKPYMYFALEYYGWDKKRPKLAFGFIHDCNGMEVQLFKQRWTVYKAKCKECEEVDRRFDEAKERIIEQVREATSAYRKEEAEKVYTPPTNEDGSVKTRKGAMLDWIQE